MGGSQSTGLSACLHQSTSTPEISHMIVYLLFLIPLYSIAVFCFCLIHEVPSIALLSEEPAAEKFHHPFGSY